MGEGSALQAATFVFAALTLPLSLANCIAENRQDDRLGWKTAGNPGIGSELQTEFERRILRIDPCTALLRVASPARLDLETSGMLRKMQ